MSCDDGLGVKSGAFLAYPDGEMWNPSNFACARVGRKSIRSEMSCDDDLGLKPAGFFMYPCRGAKAYAPKCPAPTVWA